MEVMTVVVVIHVVGEAASPLLAEQVVRGLLALLSLRPAAVAGHLPLTSQYPSPLPPETPCLFYLILLLPLSRVFKLFSLHYTGSAH